MKAKTIKKRMPEFEHWCRYDKRILYPGERNLPLIILWEEFKEWSSTRKPKS